MKTFFALLRQFLSPTLLAPTTPVFDDEAAARKARSIEILRSEEVKYINHLPVIETVEESLRRTEEEVVQRAIALVIVAAKGDTGDHALAQSLVRQFEADVFFTPEEQAFMGNPEPTENDRIQFVWRYEAAHVLFWAMGIYHDLGHPDAVTDGPHLVATLRDLGPNGLRAKAQLRPQAEILDAADLIYRYHWTIVDARVNEMPVPPSLNPNVVYERHYTLNWLIGSGGPAWDDISTDT